MLFLRGYAFIFFTFSYTDALSVLRRVVCCVVFHASIFEGSGLAFAVEGCP